MSSVTPGTPHLRGARVRCEELGFRHPGGDSSLSLASVDLEPGSRTAVIGPSGSGKTTLLHLIAGILSPDRGTVTLDDEVISGLPEAARRRRRLAEIGLVFQEFELLEHLSVRENISLPFAIDPALGSEGRSGRVEELAGRLGLGPLLRRHPRRLSHGERQRVAIARALVVGPRLLLADEPTGNLDPRTGAVVLDQLFEEAERAGTTVLVVTHDHSLLARFQQVIDLESPEPGGGS